MVAGRCVVCRGVCVSVSFERANQYGTVATAMPAAKTRSTRNGQAAPISKPTLRSMSFIIPSHVEPLPIDGDWTCLPEQLGSLRSCGSVAEPGLNGKARQLTPGSPQTQIDRWEA